MTRFEQTLKDLRMDVNNEYHIIMCYDLSRKEPKFQVLNGDDLDPLLSHKLRNKFFA